MSGARLLANHVRGSWTESEATESLEDRDPATGEVLARVPMSGPAEVDAAVAGAADAQREWRRVSPIARARAILRLRELLLEHRAELTELVSRDLGKTLEDADGEVGRGIESVEAAAAAPHLLKGENLEGVAIGIDVELIRQPVGVVAAITPFNFPAMIPLWFLPFALAAGNGFVLKPSERDPLPSELILNLVDEVEEIPAGLVALVHGGREAVDAILDHPGIGAVSFVGQASTARQIATRGAAAGKRVQALGGAKNSIVVMPDADPELLAKGVTGSAFGAAGQRCLAGSVGVLVGSDSEQDAQREAIVAAARGLRVGPGLEPETDVGPVVAPEVRERLAAEIEQAAGRGAELALDGRGDPGPGGCFLGPTVLDGLPADDRMLNEELFGPLLGITRAPDLDAAIEFVNSSRYGNSALIFTSSGAAARAFRYGVEAGMVGVNVGIAAPVAWFPFSGWKASMIGDLHANGRDAFDFYTRKKVVTSRWG